jgi:flagellar basal-body rod protein FlgF
MVDKAIFIGTSAAKQSMHQLEIVTNNLANVTKTGFRADFESQVPINVKGSEKDSRTYSTSGRSYSDFTPGPIIKTDRDLDIAISGKGFIAIQNKQGQEGYTRDGNLQIKDGLLKTQTGGIVLGSGGVINIPANAERLMIAADGTVSVKAKGEANPVTISKIKLSDPEITQLSKGHDGSFYLPEGKSAEANDKVQITPGALEGSNVNPVEALTSLIELSRLFDLDSNLMKSIQENGTKANELLQLN